MKTIAQKPIIVGNLPFAPSKSAIVDSLFKPIDGKTACGHYKVKRGGVQFFNMRGEPWFFLVSNRYGENFFVETYKNESGKTVYMHALRSETEKQIGVESYGHGMRLASEIAESIKSR